jgi:hypothetical protein
MEDSLEDSPFLMTVTKKMAVPPPTKSTKPVSIKITQKNVPVGVLDPTSAQNAHSRNNQTDQGIPIIIIIIRTALAFTWTMEPFYWLSGPLFTLGFKKGKGIF